MVVWSTLEASCPMCGHRTRLREVGGGFVVGQDSDLLVRMSGKHLIQADIHSCLRCRFSGYAADFLRTIGPAAEKRFLEVVSPSLPSQVPGHDGSAPTCMAANSTDGGSTGSRKEPLSATPLPHVQYYWAFRAAEALALPAGEQGERLLRAYWCLRLPPSSGLPERQLRTLKKIYLTGAIGKLRHALRSESDGNRLYLVAELCRRNGNFLLAASHFRRSIETPGGAVYLKQAARKLLQLARERVSADLSMEEVLYNQASDRHGPGS